MAERSESSCNCSDRIPQVITMDKVLSAGGYHYYDAIVTIRTKDQRPDSHVAKSILFTQHANS